MTMKRKTFSQADWAEDIQKIAHKRAQLLSTAIEKAEKDLKNAPQGRLRDIKHGKDYQYFWRKEKTDTSGTYLPKNTEINMIRALAQKEYNLRFLKSANAELDALKKYLNTREKNPIEKAFDDMSEARRCQTTPFITPDDTYITVWQSKDYTPGYFAPDYPEYYTAKDERVRSKAEENIANLLKMNNVPYHYEFPIIIDEEERRPDFLCLNVRTKKEFIWEHFGMMDNLDYAQRNVDKINRMAANGYIHGHNCIFTFETSIQPLNTRIIQIMIDKFLL
ncbi:MAG: hypothetical protein J5717_00905 [Lachnospiraceae bacterium]|nr:hypothetical protein [Lachnospiraceae bacterium]